MDRPGHETDKGAVTAVTVMPAPDFGPREGPGLTPRRLLHRRHGWSWEALPASWRSFWPTVPVLMRSRRGSAPSWFLDMIIVLAR